MASLTSKRFEKMFKKCPQEVRDKFTERLKLFKMDKYDALLNNHALFGKLRGFKSINITGDWRALFEETPEGISFVAIGTHSQLYK